MADATETRDTREADMRALAHRLEFTVDKTARGFTLTRTAELSHPEREEGLTLAQAEELLETWKLRGLGGG
ncbi:MAG TPA: hypothetical protein VFW22_15950 [Pseudolabrys sp.]|nr:hypothetical protein [Pseudolabrys sp.]